MDDDKRKCETCGKEDYQDYLFWIRGHWCCGFCAISVENPCQEAPDAKGGK